jgi:hypothetical protein
MDRVRRVRQVGRLLVSLLAVAAVGASPANQVAPPSWARRLDALPEDAPSALARGPDGRLALGGARSVRVIDPEGGVETRLRRGPVSDLAYSPDGVLWVATGQGLYRIAPDGSSRHESLARHDDERRVLRLAASDGLVAAATDQGVQLREADGTWRTLRVLPSGAASLVAFRQRGPDLELWSAIDGELWIAARDGVAGSPWRFVTRESLPLLDREREDARDLLFDLADADALLVFPGFLAARDAAGAWRSLRPALPPGAQASRVARAFEKLWLGTDAGLLVASELRGPWRRAPQPLGSLPVVDMVGGASLAVATHRGLHVAARRTEAAPPPVPVSGAPTVDHVRAVARLHRAALRQQGLQPESMRDLRERVRLRGWWPELDVSFGYADFDDHRRDWDQSFVSGSTHHLFDRQSDQGRDYDVDVKLSWDLGDTAFHPDELDALRESRSLIALRDDVLDEVTALYFERQEVLARLAASRDAAERISLELRAAELAAGLDAWTGGAFSALDANPPPAVPRGD